EIARALDRAGDELEQLSRKIHDHPELGYQEVKASAWLAEFLGARGFKVERGIAGVDTAFRATLDTGDGPTVAIMCEYDALPGIITNGGAAPNIIPEFAAATFYVRAPRIDEMWTLHARVVACAEGAARASGCTLNVVDYENAYEPMKRNEAFLALWRANLTTLGVGES